MCEDRVATTVAGSLVGLSVPLFAERISLKLALIYAGTSIAEMSLVCGRLPLRNLLGEQC